LISNILLIISILGIVLLLTNYENIFFIFLIFPLISILIYRGMFLFYAKIFGRPPVDTFFNWNSGLMSDRIFNIGFVLFGILLPIVIVVWIENMLK